MSAIPMDTLEDGPDLDVIARQIVAAKRKLRPGVPASLDLASRITSLSVTDTMEGSSTLTITILDDDWELLDSGFFDNDADGKLDPIDINYPQGSRFWWRITQVSPSSGQAIELTCMERAAVYLMAHKGPVKTSRAKKTRAEFLKTLTDKVKAGGGITFISAELHRKQPTVKDDPPKKKTDDSREQNKDSGIDSSEKLAGKEGTLGRQQVRTAEEMLDVAIADDAPTVAIQALVIAGLVEGPDFKNPTHGGAGGGYAGPLQYSIATFGMDHARDPSWVAHHFLTKGATGAGGAIEWANKGLSPPEIINKIHNPGGQQFYDGEELAHKADAIIEAYGGGGLGGGTTYRQQYNFQVGSQDEPHETYWDAMGRLAEDVNWAMFLDGSRCYFDAETTLIKQKPAAIIRRGDPAVTRWSGDWDARHIATQMELELICDPFAFRAGQVFKLEDFGPFSTGSTAKLPGRWLISEIDREPAAISSTFTLKQPEKPNREPVSEIAERDDAETSGVGSGDLYQACKAISDEGHSYPHPDTHHGPWRNIDKDTPLDCSESTALALHMAGLFDESQAWVSGQFASSYGKPGRGEQWTVWANSGHVFIQSEGSGEKWRFDTGGHPGVSGPRLLDEHRSTAGFTPRHRGGSEDK
jgi:hypothetical protein